MHSLIPELQNQGTIGVLSFGGGNNEAFDFTL